MFRRMYRQAATVVAATLFLGASSLAVAAPPAAPLKIGVVNIERIFRDAPAALKAQKHLEKEFSGREQELQKLAQHVRELQDSLTRDGMTMAENDRRARERDLAAASRDFQRAQRDLSEKLNARKNEEIVALNERIKKTILDIAEREHFDLILHEGIYYAVPRIDLTDRVLKQLGDR